MSWLRQWWFRISRGWAMREYRKRARAIERLRARAILPRERVLHLMPADEARSAPPRAMRRRWLDREPRFRWPGGDAP